MRQAMLTIAVCDDEVLFRMNLVNKLKRVCENKECYIAVDEFCSGEEFLSAKTYYDVVFLDVKMDQLSGIDTAKKIREENKNSKIIFITAYEEYVYEAFEVSAFQYIRKPVLEGKLSETIERILKEMENEKLADHYFLLTKGVQTLKICESDILFFEVQNRVVKIHMDKEEIEYYGSLEKVEAQLSSETFFRCHRSYIVNLKHVKSYNRIEIQMENGEKILLSGRKYEAFSKAFLGFLKRGAF